MGPPAAKPTRIRFHTSVGRIADRQETGTQSPPKKSDSKSPRTHPGRWAVVEAVSNPHVGERRRCASCTTGWAMADGDRCKDCA